jgi:hypothetical protein
MRTLPPRGIALTAALVVTAGCLFDGDGSPATLDNVWPNEDGSRWIYELTQRT